MIGPVVMENEKHHALVRWGRGDQGYLLRYPSGAKFRPPSSARTARAVIHGERDQRVSMCRKKCEVLVQRCPTSVDEKPVRGGAARHRTHVPEHRLVSRGCRCWTTVHDVALSAYEDAACLASIWKGKARARETANREVGRKDGMRLPSNRRRSARRPVCGCLMV